MKEKNASCETYKKLESYVELLLKWNRSINLISPSTESSIWERHINDSLSLLQFLKEPKGKIFDFGSGAGLPGIPLAIMGANSMNLVEVDVKKSAFLRHVGAALKLNFEVHNKLFSQIILEDIDCVISRAVFSVLDFCECLFDLKFNGDCFLLKGENIGREIEEAQKKWRFDYQIYSDKSTILKLSKIRKV